MKWISGQEASRKHSRRP